MASVPHRRVPRSLFVSLAASFVSVAADHVSLPSPPTASTAQAACILPMSLSPFDEKPSTPTIAAPAPHANANVPPPPELPALASASRSAKLTPVTCLHVP